MSSSSRSSLRFLCLLATGTLSALSVTSAAHAQNLNLNFGYINNIKVPSSTFGASADQPGVWNPITTTGTTSSLLDLTGAASDVNLTLTASSMVGGGAISYSDDIGKLRLNDFYSNPGSIWQVTFSNLTNGTYDVYVYAPSNTSIPTRPFTVNGISVASQTGNASPTLVEGQDWVEISGVSVTDQTLTLTSTSTSGLGGLSGIQLANGPVGNSAAAPEPGSLALLGMGGMGSVVGMIRRRRRA